MLDSSNVYSFFKTRDTVDNQSIVAKPAHQRKSALSKQIRERFSLTPVHVLPRGPA